MKFSRYVKIYPYDKASGAFLLYSTKRASKILLHESTLRSIEEDTLSPPDIKTLTDLGFLVPDPEEEKRQMLTVFESARWDRFSAMVVMNLDCNLACTYCYEGKMKGKHYMTSETADRLVDFIEDSSEGRDVHLDFYGGEPLLSLGLLKDISGRLMSSLTAKNLGYSFNLVTNGTLLSRKNAEGLLPLGLKGAKVTLDGPRQLHDRSRPFKGMTGSFDKIVGNIRDVCGIVDIQIGGNYSIDNFRGFPALLDYLIEEGITPDKVSIVKFTPITKAKAEFSLPEFDDGCSSINEPWIIESSLFLREEILKRGFVTSAILPSFCMIESRDDIVINYDGTLYKCPGFLGWKGMAIGDLEKGIDDYGGSYNLEVWKRDECLECAYLPLCFGGCRFMKLIRDGNVSDVDCRKPYLDAALEAFVKQDIEYGLKAQDR
jgi:uncharacterized protein